MSYDGGEHVGSGCGKQVTCPACGGSGSITTYADIPSNAGGTDEGGFDSLTRYGGSGTGQKREKSGKTQTLRRGDGKAGIS